MGGMVYVVLEDAHHLATDGLGLGAVAARASVVIDAIHGDEAHLRRAVVHRGEGVEFAVVVLVVAEGDKRLVAAAIVPTEVARGHGKRDTIVEDRLHVVVLSLALVRLLHLEETRRRHLLRVSHYHERLSARYRTHGLRGRHLRGLVEDHEIERRLVEVEKLCHAHRAHEHTGAEARQQRGYLVDNLADARPASSTGYIALENAQLRGFRRLDLSRRDGGSQLVVEFLLREHFVARRYLAVFSYLFLEKSSVEEVQRLLLVDDIHGHPLIDSLGEGVGYLCHRHSGIVPNLLDEVAEMMVAEHLLALAPDGPVAHTVEMVRPLVDMHSQKG